MPVSSEELQTFLSDFELGRSWPEISARQLGFFPFFFSSVFVAAHSERKRAFVKMGVSGGRFIGLFGPGGQRAVLLGLLGRDLSCLAGLRAAGLCGSVRSVSEGRTWLLMRLGLKA